jgi:hypothetical protein
MAIVAFLRRASGEVIGKIIDEQGEIVSSKNFSYG